MPAFPQQAIVLAAGLGTRLRPLTLRIPKPALPLGGVPILFFNLILLKNAGIHRVTINLHHRPEVIRDLLGNGRHWGLHLRYSYEPKILGTAGGIAQALDGMKKEATFVLNGDILMDLDLKAMAAEHFRTAAKATLACVGMDRAKVTSFVEHDKQGKIWRIAGAPSAKSPPLTAAIFSGAHLLDPELLTGYPRKHFGCIIRQVYQPTLEGGKRLQAYRHRGAWWDLGTLEELKQVDSALWRRKLPQSILELWRQAQARL